jgi:vitamin B12 transporter
VNYQSKIIIRGLTPIIFLPTLISSANAQSLDEILVTSSRISQSASEIATSISYLGEDELNLRGYASLFDALRTQTGVAATNAGGVGKATTVRIRGEEGYRTLVLVDGIEVSDPSGVQVMPQIHHVMSGSSIGGVEILRGPQAFAYGADAGGVINIRSIQAKLAENSDRGQNASINLGLGSFSTRVGDAAYNFTNGQFDLSLSARRYETDGFNARLSDTTLQDDDGYENTTLHARLGWNLSENLRLEGVVIDTDAISEYDACGFPGTHDCIEDYQQTAYRISAIWNSESTEHQFSLKRSETDRDDIYGGISAFKTGGGIEHLEYQGSFRYGDPSTVNSTLVFGVDLEDESIVTSDGQNLQRDQNGIRGEYILFFSDSTTASAGLRYDDNDDFGEHTSYRLSFSHRQALAQGMIKYRASVGNGFRAPSLFEISYNAGPFAFPPAASAQLIEETSQGYELGVGFVSESGHSLGFTWFDQKIEDEIFFDLAGFSGYLQEQGTTRSKGLEIEWHVALFESLDWYGNYTWNDTKTRSGDQRIRRPEHLVNVGLRFETGKLEALLNLRFSRNAVDEVFGQGRIDLDDYEVLDIGARYQFANEWSVNMSVENLFDSEYREITDFRNAGRTAFIRMGYNFSE